MLFYDYFIILFYLNLFLRLRYMLLLYYIVVLFPLSGARYCIVYLFIVLIYVIVNLYVLLLLCIVLFNV